MCLRSGHSRADCRSKKPCYSCRAEDHHSTLCRKQEEATVSSDDEEDDASHQVEANQCAFITATGAESDASDEYNGDERRLFVGVTKTAPAIGGNHNAALFLTSKANVFNADEPSRSAKRIVFFDCGSNQSFIKKELAEKLKLKTLGEEMLRITTITTSKPQQVSCTKHEIAVAHNDGTYAKVTVYALDTIVGEITTVNVKPSDTNPDKPWKIQVNTAPDADVLIGADKYWDFDIVRADTLSNGLKIVESSFGYMAAGVLPPEMQKAISDVKVGVLVLHVEDTSSSAEADAQEVSSQSTLDDVTLERTLNPPYVPTNWGIPLRCSIPLSKEVMHAESATNTLPVQEENSVVVNLTRYEELEQAEKAAVSILRAAAKFLYMIGKHSTQPQWDALRQTVSEATNDEEYALMQRFLVQQDQRAFPPTQEEFATYELQSDNFGLISSTCRPERNGTTRRRFFLAPESRLRTLLMRAIYRQYKPHDVTGAIRWFNEAFLSPGLDTDAIEKPNAVHEALRDLTLRTTDVPHSEPLEVGMQPTECINNSTEGPSQTKKPRLDGQKQGLPNLRPGELEEETSDDAGSLKTSRDEPNKAPRYFLRPRKHIFYLALLSVILIQLGTAKSVSIISQITCGFNENELHNLRPTDQIQRISPDEARLHAHKRSDDEADERKRHSEDRLQRYSKQKKSDGIDDVYVSHKTQINEVVTTHKKSSDGEKRSVQLQKFKRSFLDRPLALLHTLETGKKREEVYRTSACTDKSQKGEDAGDALKQRQEVDDDEAKKSPHKHNAHPPQRENASVRKKIQPTRSRPCENANSAAEREGSKKRLSLTEDLYEKTTLRLKDDEAVAESSAVSTEMEIEARETNVESNDCTDTSEKPMCWKSYDSRADHECLVVNVDKMPTTVDTRKWHEYKRPIFCREEIKDVRAKEVLNLQVNEEKSSKPTTNCSQRTTETTRVRNHPICDTKKPEDVRLRYDDKKSHGHGLHSNKQR